MEHKELNRTAAEIHMEYRSRADNAVNRYSQLRTDFPLSEFPVHAAKVWRFAMLARVWGDLATSLCGGAIDYVEKWRTGK